MDAILMNPDFVAQIARAKGARNILRYFAIDPPDEQSVPSEYIRAATHRRIDIHDARILTKIRRRIANTDALIGFVHVFSDMSWRHTHPVFRDVPQWRGLSTIFEYKITAYPVFPIAQDRFVRATAENYVRYKREIAAQYF